MTTPWKLPDNIRELDENAIFECHRNVGRVLARMVHDQFGSTATENYLHKVESSIRGNLEAFVKELGGGDPEIEHAVIIVGSSLREHYLKLCAPTLIAQAVEASG